MICVRYAVLFHCCCDLQAQMHKISLLYNRLAVCFAVCHCAPCQIVSLWTGPQCCMPYVLPYKATSVPSFIISPHSEIFFDLAAGLPALTAQIHKYVRTTLWTEKTHQNVFWYKVYKTWPIVIIWYILSWVNLLYRNVNVLCLTRVVSLPYFGKLAFAFCRWTPVRTVNRKKHTKMFCISYTKQGWFWWSLVHVFLIKFAIAWCQSQKVAYFQ